MYEILQGEDARKVKERQQSALVTCKQSIKLCDESQFGSSIKSVATTNLPILLFDSCDKGLIEHVDIILKHDDADPTMECTKKSEKYPILVAARNGYYKIVDSLLKNIYSLGKLTVGLKQKNIWGNSIFHIIIKELSKSRKEKLNQSDYDNYCKAMDVLMEYKEYIENNLIIDEEDYSLICEASEENLCDFVEILLHQGANPVSYFKTREKRNPLQLACFNGNGNIVKILINHIEQKERNGKEMLKDFLNVKDEWGNTVLHIILSGKENKKRVEETQEETTEDNYLTCMELVLSIKEFIDIDAVNMKGNTALHKAAKLFKNKRFANLLIDKGARMDIKNTRGLIPEVFNSNQRAEDELKDNIDQELIIESTNLLKEALTKGHYLEVKKLFDSVIEKKHQLQFSDKIIKSFLDIIVKDQRCDNTEELHQSTATNYKQKKQVKKIKKLKGNSNVDFNKCMDIVLEYNKDFCSNAKEIIGQVLFTVCDRGISNLVEPLLKCEANYSQLITDNHKSSSLQIAFKKGYHLIAKKLLKNDTPHQLQSDNWVKEVLDNIVIGLKKKNGMQCRGANKKTKREKQEEKKREISDVIEKEQNFRKCFEILLDPNLKFHKYEIKSDQALFYKICSNGLTELADCLIDNKADPCVEFKDDEKDYEKSPIHIASRYGYHELVDLLLNKMKERGDEKLKQGLQMTNKWENLTIHNVVRSVTKKDKNEKKIEDLNPDIDYYKCLECLLKYKEYYNIDAQDCLGNTALHYAIQLRDDQRFIKLLMMNGSQMTIKNNKHIIAKSKIVPSLIEEILDSCIKAEGDESVVDDLRITIDLSIFSHKHDSKTKTETELLIALRDSRTHKHLFFHPVISIFLFIKWQKIKTIWYTNLVFYLLFFSCLMSYICYMDMKSEPNDTARMISLNVIISVMSLYMLIRDIIQIFIFKLSFFKNFDNLLEVFILIMTWLLLYNPDLSIQCGFSAWIVVSLVAQIILLFGTIPLFQSSIYITMFKRVTFNFLKIIALLFLWITLAFSFSFFIMFTKSLPENQNSTSPDSDNSFITFTKALLKTTVMSTGEMEYTSLPFDLSYPVSSRLLFLTFIFVIVFVIMNLINGIAISDIQIIQKEAEHYAVISEAEYIIGINETIRILLKIPYLDCLNIIWNCLNRFWNYCLIFDDCFTTKSIGIFPNRHYGEIFASCQGHSCSLSKINHCPYYFWLNIWPFSDLLEQLWYLEMCNECKIYYDKRVQTKDTHKCERKYECGICKRYKYRTESSKKIHICLHKHKYYIKSMSIEAAKNIVIKQRQEEERKEKEEEERRRDMKLSQMFKEIVEEKQKREQLQRSVN